MTNRLIGGFSLYSNGSLNSAKDTTSGQWLPNAPWALGAIYDQSGYYASIIEKWVGARNGDVGQTQYFDPYGMTNLSVGYTWERPQPWAPCLLVGA